MASHDSAKKSIRKSVRQRAVNVNRLSRIRTFVKKLESSLVDGTPRDGILSAFAKMQSEMMKGINKHVLHKNTVARKISKISKIVKQAIGDVI